MVGPASDNLLDGIAPKKVSHEAPGPKKRLKPWHRPRKQFVRRRQWLGEVEALIPELRLEAKLIKYLTLPGEDMFDVRILADYCNQKGLRLSVLGFDEGRTSPTEVDISANELSNCIEPESVILPDNLEELASPTSQGFMYVRRNGPFDVINLDLCGAFSCINNPDNHQVLNNLCEYQINNRREPWLLFVTTRAEFARVNPEHLPHYLKQLRENALHSKVFAHQLTVITGFAAENYDGESVPADFSEPSNGFGFVKVFTSGFAKWLLRLMLASQNKWTLEMLDSYWYRVGQGSTAESFPNMLSLAFKFYPVDTALTDPTGLAASNPSPEIDEEALAIAMLNKLSSMIDLDHKVDADEALYSEIVAQNIMLLEQARYPQDVLDQYEDWAARTRLRFASN